MKNIIEFLEFKKAIYESALQIYSEKKYGGLCVCIEFAIGNHFEDIENINRFIKTSYDIDIDIDNFPDYILYTFSEFAVKKPTHCDVTDYWWPGDDSEIRISVMKEIIEEVNQKILHLKKMYFRLDVYERMLNLYDTKLKYQINENFCIGLCYTLGQVINDTDKNIIIDLYGEEYYKLLNDGIILTFVFHELFDCKPVDARLFGFWWDYRNTEKRIDVLKFIIEITQNKIKDYEKHIKNT